VKFFKCAVYVLFTLCLVNLASILYVHNDIIKRQQIEVELPTDLKDLPQHARARESQLLQSILIIHHEMQIHKAGQQEFCPMCSTPNLLTVND
jgi:hypothetical protein